MEKTVLVTGASRGIGQETARLFAEKGARVAVNYCSSKAAATEFVQELKEKGWIAEAFWADVSNREQVKRMYQQINKRLGAVEILINNAGIAQQKLFTDLTEQDWERMFAVNVKGAFEVTQAVLPEMIRKKQGKIVNISSMWGVTGASCEVHYSAAKAALIGFTKALAKEVGPSGICVNCIAPGVIATQMNAMLSEQTLKELKEETPLGRIGTPREIAELAYFLSSEKADFLTGQIITADGGMTI